MDFDPVRSVTIRLTSGQGERTAGRFKGSEEAVKRVFRTSRDMKAYHERLLHERKTASTLTTASSRASPTEFGSRHLKAASIDAANRSEEINSRAADASTETDFDPKQPLSVRVEKRDFPAEVTLNPSFVIPEAPKVPRTAPRRLLVTAGSVRSNGLSMTSKLESSKEQFVSNSVWAESTTRCMPIIDFNSTVRTTIVHVEEMFSPRRLLRPAAVSGFYSRVPPKTSPRTKRIRLHSLSPKPPKEVNVRASESPLMPEDIYEEVLPKQIPPVSTMWKYRGKVVPSVTASIFDIRPIIAWKARLDAALRS